MFWFQQITQQGPAHHAKCPPVEMVSSPVRSQSAPGGGARYCTDTGVRPPRGGAQTKQRERRLQAETLRANTAQAALSKQSLTNLHSPPGPGHGGGTVLTDWSRWAPLWRFFCVFIARKTLSIVLALACEAKLG